MPAANNKTRCFSPSLRCLLAESGYIALQINLPTLLATLFMQKPKRLNGIIQLKWQGYYFAFCQWRLIHQQFVFLRLSYE